ncbi:hypothetical protein D3C75_909360 [compost metagenome]
MVPVKFSSTPTNSITAAIVAVIPGVVGTTGISRVPTNRLATKLAPNIAVVAIATITQAK